ncbi:sulfatase-like hydrolase/transferase [Membranihabitans marinus]|nr:sulfatase-like hydrolase/transferase [Membranihabitans marinus]
MPTNIRYFAILILIWPYLSAWSQEPSTRPNIIIFMTDDQGYADVGFNGNDKIITPELDQLAAHSMVFDRCYTAPVCSPTRAGLLTGRYPTRAGVFYWGHALRPQEQTMAEILKKEGYQTAFFGKWHLGSIRKDQPTNPGAQGFDTWYAAANFYENDPWMSHNGQPVHLQGESSMVTVDLAMEYINEASKRDAPFLVFIWTGAPHIPHEASDELKSLYPGEPDDMKNYMGEITGIDRSIGALKSGLEKLKIDKETVLWFSSDNGGRLPHANNGHLRSHKGTLYEGGIRVPAFMYWPGHIDPGTTEVPVSTIDLLPTVLDIAGISSSVLEHPVDGMNMMPAVRSRTDQRENPLGFWVYPEIKGHSVRSDQIISDYNDILQGKGDRNTINDGLLNLPEQDYSGLDHYPYSGTSVWIDGQWKLIQTAEGYELYNLEEDPSESNNLAESEKSQKNRMKKALRKWQKSVVASIKGQDYE